MPEGKRPTSFGQARAQGFMALSDDERMMNNWLYGIEKQLKDIGERISASGEAVQAEQEDKNFWGTLATMGTTLGCMAFWPASWLGCTVAGAVAGAGARIAVDVVGQADENIPDKPGIGDLIPMPDPKFYQSDWDRQQDKIGDLTEDLGEHIQDIQDFNANAWKLDLVGQATDSWNAMRIGNLADSLNIFDKAPTELTDPVPTDEITLGIGLADFDPNVNFSDNRVDEYLDYDYGSDYKFLGNFNFGQQLMQTREE